MANYKLNYLYVTDESLREENNELTFNKIDRETNRAFDRNI